MRTTVRLLLFDIDGTLLSGKGAGARAMTRAGRRVLGDRFSLDGIDFGGRLDPWIYAEAARLTGYDEADERHDAFREAYLVELERELVEGTTKPLLLPGVGELLDRLLRRSDVALGLVTGNYRRAVPLKFGSVGLSVSHFPFGAFGDDADTRARLVHLAMAEWARAGGTGDPNDTIVIGDTPRDIRCAQENGCRCLAVATGRDSVENLERAGADAVARDLTDVDVLLRWIAE
jgi:phosphoglycolate phosphatase-like HAD superfamily hydrolase